MLEYTLPDHLQDSQHSTITTHIRTTIYPECSETALRACRSGVKSSTQGETLMPTTTPWASPGTWCASSSLCSLKLSASGWRTGVLAGVCSAVEATAEEHGSCSSREASGASTERYHRRPPLSVSTTQQERHSDLGERRQVYESAM
jgi:hypothetical protein